MVETVFLSFWMLDVGKKIVVLIAAKQLLVYHIAYLARE